MTKYDYDSGTSKQQRKFREYKRDYNNKKSQIINIRNLLKNNKRSMAKKCIDTYLEEYKEDGYILHELGKYYFLIGDLESAKKYYEQVIANNYRNKYYSMYELAKIEKYNTNYNRSLELLDEILKSDHDEKCHADLEKAKIYYILDRYEEYLEIVSALILTKQKNRVYAFDSLTDYAIDFYDAKILTKFFGLLKNEFTEDEKAYYLGIINKLQKHINQSKKYFNIVASGNGQFKYRAKYHLAITYFEEENYSESIELAEEVCEKFDGLAASCYRLLSSIYMIFDEDEKSMYYIDKLKQFGGYQKNIINGLYGDYYFNKNQYDKALEHYLQVESVNRSIYYDSLHRIGCILIKQKKYKEALEIFTKLQECDYTDKFDLDCRFASIFLSKQLGMEVNEKSDIYSAQQILNYSRDKAIKHIKEHKKEKNEKNTHSIFAKEIDIENLYDYAITHINEENFYYNNFMDLYMLNYPNIGTVNDESANYLMVVTIPNSKEIITMYPCNKIISKAKESSSKVKRMSTIDKFKQKYGNL